MPNEKDTWSTRTGNELWWITGGGTEGKEITQTSHTAKTTPSTRTNHTTQSAISTRTTHTTRSTLTSRLKTQAPQYKQHAKHQAQHRQEKRREGSRWNVLSFVYVTLCMLVSLRCDIIRYALSYL